MKTWVRLVHFCCVTRFCFLFVLCHAPATQDARTLLQSLASSQLWQDLIALSWMSQCCVRVRKWAWREFQLLSYSSNPWPCSSQVLPLTLFFPTSFEAHSIINQTVSSLYTIPFLEVLTVRRWQVLLLLHTSDTQINIIIIIIICFLYSAVLHGFLSTEQLKIQIKKEEGCFHSTRSAYLKLKIKLHFSNWKQFLKIKVFKAFLKLGKLEQFLSSF